MWYEESYNASIEVIRNSKRILTEKEYKSIAKELNLLTPDSLQFISGFKFRELVRQIRKQVA